MDSLTHAVIGACLGDAIAGKKIGKKAMLWGAVANNLPDIDVITSFYMGHADSLLAHRGFTHSILFALLASPLFAFLFHRWYSNTTMLFKDWLLIWGTGNFIHIIIDSFTCYGTGWLEPFDHLRVSFDLLFVADPFFTIALLISAIALMIMKKDNPARRKWSNGAFIICGLYLVMAVGNKIYIHSTTEKQLTKSGISTDDYFTTPTPLNNFLWYLVAKSDTGFYIGYKSIFDKSDEIKFGYRAQNENFLAGMPADKDLDKLKRFSKGYYVIDTIGGQIYFNDIRFGQISGWENYEANFVFRYILGEGANNDIVIQRGRMEGSGRKALASLWGRMWGI
ncbi:MAG TPA: metal-dependent hydrolase [Bacteroidia bacterium]|nr:metal-dependent hydrolase [Bacteroidota bacterium]HQW00449.1 metal-dependent hydrolase [Bacteroidia bacterium]HQW22632.1 metal-dependent hydrolase [Bacteroidia bacterium]